jgi:excisionase family DNA binding protein
LTSAAPPGFTRKIIGSHRSKCLFFNVSDFLLIKVDTSDFEMVEGGCNMQKTTFTLSEAAELLLCHKETLRKAILDGVLQAARLGRGYRISRSDLRKFWTERGGGELFELTGEAEKLTGAAPADEDAVSGRPGQDVGDKKTGPHQLTLPLV